MKQLHFISGLPRSGTTLLSSLLKQNPNIYANISSPTNAIVSQLIAIDTQGFNKIINKEKVQKLIKATFDIMYDDYKEDIIFDTNRCWSGKVDILHDTTPNSKIICCVRDIPSILNSFEHIYRQNHYLSGSTMYGGSTDIYSRADGLYNNGILGVGLTNLKTGLHSVHTENLFLLEYENLVEKPQEMIDQICDFIGIEKFTLDLENIKVVDNVDVVDNELNLFGLHEIRPKLEKRELHNYLPYDLLEKYNGTEYWRKLFETAEENV